MGFYLSTGRGRWHRTWESWSQRILCQGRMRRRWLLARLRKWERCRLWGMLDRSGWLVLVERVELSRALSRGLGGCWARSNNVSRRTVYAQRWRGVRGRAGGFRRFEAGVSFGKVAALSSCTSDEWSLRSSSDTRE